MVIFEAFSQMVWTGFLTASWTMTEPVKVGLSGSRLMSTRYRVGDTSSTSDSLSFGACSAANDAAQQTIAIAGSNCLFAVTADLLSWKATWEATLASEFSSLIFVA